MDVGDRVLVDQPQGLGWVEPVPHHDRAGQHKQRKHRQRPLRRVVGRAGQQGEALATIIEQGVHERAAMYDNLGRRDFYFDYFYQPQPDDDEEDDG